MFTIAIVAVVIAFILILLLRRSTAPIQREEDFYVAKDSSLLKLERLNLAQFEAICLEILAKMGLTIKSCRRVRDSELDIMAENPAPLVGGNYVVHCFLVGEDEVVEPNLVIGLSDTVKAERASKGILITNGYFSQEVGKFYEGAPVELINCRRLKELMDQFEVEPQESMVLPFRAQ